MKTVFIRAIEAAVDEKATVIREAVQTGGKFRFDADIPLFVRCRAHPLPIGLVTQADCALGRTPNMNRMGELQGKG